MISDENNRWKKQDIISSTMCPRQGHLILPLFQFHSCFCHFPFLIFLAPSGFMKLRLSLNYEDDLELLILLIGTAPCLAVLGFAHARQARYQLTYTPPSFFYLTVIFIL